MSIQICAVFVSFTPPIVIVNSGCTNIDTNTCYMASMNKLLRVKLHPRRTFLVNSILDRMLPIHATLSSGNETVVRLLIKEVAAVDAAM
jgi:hypothetical protein